jgi:nucleoside-diphosphate-sugar epimerase
MLNGKILITGGTGFVGSNLAEALVQKKYAVKCFVRANSDIAFLSNLGVELASGDITDKTSLVKSLKDVTAVFHLAAVLGKWGLPASVYSDINTVGTKLLLEACQETHVKRFIYCSTGGVLGPVNKPPADESYLYAPSNPYEIGKVEAEKLVLSYKKKLEITIVRPGLVYGPRDQHVLKLFKAIKEKKYFILGNGKNFVHPTFIGDLTEGFILCLQNPKSIGETYLIVGEKYVSMEEFVNLVTKNLGLNVTLRHVPIWAANVLAGLAEVGGKLFRFEPPLTFSRVKTLSDSRAYSYVKAAKQLGYNPIPLENGLRKTIRWYIKNGDL